MKKKFFAIVLSLVMFFSLFSGCSVIKQAPAYTDDTVLATLYGQNITYADLKEKYEAYSQYFAYYDEDLVMQVIYDELYLEALEKYNAKNLVVLSQDEVDELLDTLYHVYVHMADAKEQVLLSFYGKDVPERVSNSSESSESDNITFEEYEFEAKTPIDFSKIDAAEEVNLANKITDLMAVVNKDVTSSEQELRDKAWDMVLADLVYSYKMNGKTLSKKDALVCDMQERFDSLYQNKVIARYKEYVESTVFGETVYGSTSNEQLAGQINEESVVSKIVSKYKELLNANKQKANSKETYTQLLFSTTNTDIVLYHYYDEDMEKENIKFFTVLHLLVSFDDATKTELNQYPGSSDSADYIFRQEYEEARLNKAYDGSSWTISTTYRDEEGNTVKTEKRDDENNIVYETDEFGEYVLDGDGEKIAVMVDKTITLEEIKNAFEAEWSQILTENPSLTSAQKAHKRTELFRKYMFLYTDENEYSNLNSDKMIDLMGYAVSTEEGENAGLMKEFADTAKELYFDYENSFGAKFVGEDIKFAVTSYGVHMMILNNVYAPGEIVSLTKEVSGDTVDKTDAEILADLQTTVISNYKGQTLLEYVYEAVAEDELNSFFSDYLYEVLDNAEKNGQFVIKVKPTYEDLRKY